MNFHVKAKIQINLLDFSCQNTDANEFIWFYLSKHKIELNFQDFSYQKANLIWNIWSDWFPLKKIQIQINLWKIYTYLLTILKKIINLTRRARWSSGYNACLSHKRPGFNSLDGMDFFFIFFTYLNIFFNLRLNSWLMTA